MVEAMDQFFRLNVICHRRGWRRILSSQMETDQRFLFSMYVRRCKLLFVELLYGLPGAVQVGAGEDADEENMKIIFYIRSS